jgi:hypothetical protein
MKKLWTAFLFLAWCAPAPAQERFNGYSTAIVTTWATNCANEITPMFMQQMGMDYLTAMALAQYSCSCTIDHWREAMPYQTAMALDKEARREKSKQYALMCASKSEEL